ncbi:AT-hook motif nuclear-localized protein 11-like isoform X2 [Zingiber officinale]|uniref:AT-hook motif nuclear-localized protein 11-like isoform X2 n=1 Tax=Zingiber officinale TaxID=94328 RepID=UPI001C4C7F43|nr:AT-hook motif nuclear-localized protein 11-like isoform X2 [Zingiber officinale]
MDGRDAMELSGAASYYIAHRGIHGSSVGSQPGLHLTAQPGARSIPNLGTRLAVPPSGVDSVAFQVESPLAASSHGGGRLGKGVSQVEPVKRKRGRPRKYGQEGSVALALSPISTSAPTSSVIGSVSASGSGVPTQKRGRGRPPGTGRKQVLASLGDWVAGSAGMGFTPHVITIAVGEGRFQILCLSGLYMRTDNGGSRSRTGGLSVCLSSPDGQIIGGGVAGVLIAATPVQVIVGSFIYTRSKTKNKAKASRNETNPEAERPAPYAALPNPNLTPSPIIGAWPRSRHLDMRNAHIDIDLMQG